MAESRFSITEDKSDSKTGKLIIKGPVSSTNADVLNNEIDKLLKSDRNCIILNMGEVSFLASGGIRVLLKYHKQSRSLNFSFNIEAPSENVRNVLGMVALDEMLLK